MRCTNPEPPLGVAVGVPTGDSPGVIDTEQSLFLEYRVRLELLRDRRDPMIAPKLRGEVVAFIPTLTGHEIAAADIPRARAALTDVGTRISREYQYQASFERSSGSKTALPKSRVRRIGHRRKNSNHTLSICTLLGQCFECGNERCTPTYICRLH